MVRFTDIHPFVVSTMVVQDDAKMLPDRWSTFVSERDCVRGQAVLAEHVAVL